MRMDIIKKKPLCVTYTSSSTFEHQKIQYRELTSSKGSFTIKLPSSHDVDLIGVNLDPKYQIWNTSEPGNGSALCQLVLENYDRVLIDPDIFFSHFK